METKKPGTDIVLYQPLELQKVERGPQAPPDAEFVELDARQLPPADDGAKDPASEPREPHQEPGPDNNEGESKSEQYLRDIAAGLAFLVDSQMKKDRAADDEPAPGDKPDTPEPPDLSGVEDRLDHVGAVLEHIAAQNTPPPRPPRPPSQLSLTAAELDARKDPDPELTTALSKLSQIEKYMKKLDVPDDGVNPYPGKVSTYDSKLKVKSQMYVNTLLAAAVQDNIEDVKIGLHGMRLIRQSLIGDIPPTPEGLVQLSRVVEQQINRADDPVSPDNPLVREITDKLKLEKWRLSDDQVERLEGIIALDHLEGPIVVEPPKQSVWERFKRGSSKYVETKKIPNTSPEGVLTQQIEEWWAHSNDSSRVHKSVTMGSNEHITLPELKFRLARLNAQRSLDLHRAAERVTT